MLLIVWRQHTETYRIKVYLFIVYDPRDVSIGFYSVFWVAKSENKKNLTNNYYYYLKKKPKWTEIYDVYKVILTQL